MEKTNHTVLKAKLMAMCFLQFAVWGAYLTSMGNYLGNAGMGDLIAWFFAIQGFVCLIMPALVGMIGDKYIEPQRLLGLCHLLAGATMAACWWMGYQYPHPDRALFVTLYTLSTAFFMPTVALSNSVSFRLLRANGMDTVKQFPRIRVFGSIGFIAAMIFVNFAYLRDGHFGFSMDGTDRFQFQCWQFLTSAILSFILCAYTFALPRIKIAAGGQQQSLYARLGLNALSIFKQSRIVVFFIFSVMIGMCLKVTNGYAAPFITSFMSQPEYATGFGASNANLLNSLAQCSEAVCILFVPFFMRRYGVKATLVIAMAAWVLRFGTFAVGNPGSGMWLLIVSMLVYGIAFDFFNIAGAIYIEQSTDKTITASAQGLWMMSTMGIGASVGTLIAGKIIDYYCHWEKGTGGIAYLVGDWGAVWGIFAVFSLILCIAFCLTFKPKQ